MYSKICRYICLRKPFQTGIVPVESDCRYIEETLVASKRQALLRLQETHGRSRDPLLLSMDHIVLRRRLDAEPAGLDLYKMYSFSIEGYYVDLKMSASVVPFQDGVPSAFQKVTDHLLALPS